MQSIKKFFGYCTMYIWKGYVIPYYKNGVKAEWPILFMCQIKLTETFFEYVIETFEGTRKLKFRTFEYNNKSWMKLGKHDVRIFTWRNMVFPESRMFYIYHKIHLYAYYIVIRIVECHYNKGNVSFVNKYIFYFENLFQIWATQVPWGSRYQKPKPRPIPPSTKPKVNRKSLAFAWRAIKTYVMHEWKMVAGS